MTLLLLRAGRLAVDLAPASGGAIARFVHDGFDLVRPMAPADMASGRGNAAACYPLVPFSNRIANGRFEYDGRMIELVSNWPGQCHPMHGHGWSAAWQIERSDSAFADISHEHDGKRGWPFRYCARQVFELDSGGLRVTFSVRNLEAHDVPVGFGLHPFFVREPDCELIFHADAVWQADEDVLPTTRVAVPDAWEFCHGRNPDTAVLDNCFEHWDGTAAIVWPSRRLRLDLSATAPLEHLVVYTPPGRPYFCVEPVSHVNGQIARTRLPGGAEVSAEIAFGISTL